MSTAETTILKEAHYLPPANSQTDEKRKRLAAALHKPEQLDEPLMQAKEKQA